MSAIDTLHGDLKIVKELVYDTCGFDLTNLNQSTDSIEYAASSFELNGKKIQYRVSKITPTKEGQFVTIRKRSDEGRTQPFDVLDALDFIVITSKKGNNLGQFIFPKSVLADMGIITRNGKDGKRGFRVYPPWDNTTNMQAEKTQGWQLKYFLIIHTNNSIDISLIKKLFNED